VGASCKRATLGGARAPSAHTLATTMALQTKRRTDRLLLRSFQVGDVVDGLAYRSETEFARFSRTSPQPFTRQRAEAFVALNVSES
jgi:hypothetical protein